MPVPVIGNVTGDAADGGAEGAADKADGQDAAASGEAGAAATAQAEEAAGEGADKALADLAAKEFTFSYTCDDPKQTKGTLKVKGDEVPVEAPEQLPVGTVCTVTEDADSAKAEGFTLTAPAPQQVTVGAGEAPATLFFINVYTPQEPAPSPLAEHHPRARPCALAGPHPRRARARPEPGAHLPDPGPLVVGHPR